MKFVVASVTVGLLVSACGCTHLQLRKSATQQARTTSDIHQQQVMDNIAKISVDPAGWPEFSRIKEGLTQLTDDGQAAVGVKWNARSIVEESLGLNAKRALTESWKTEPITNAPRLRAMWAVYHYTIYGYIPELPGYDANLQLGQIYGTNWEQMLPPPGWLKVFQADDHECLERVHCGCIVGRYCDTRACVLPGDEANLQQLTYLIMDLATVEFAGDQGFPTGNSATDALDRKGFRDGKVVPLRRGRVREWSSPTIGPAFTP